MLQFTITILRQGKPVTLRVFTEGVKRTNEAAKRIIKALMLQTTDNGFVASEKELNPRTIDFVKYNLTAGKLISTSPTLFDFVYANGKSCNIPIGSIIKTA